MKKISNIFKMMSITSLTCFLGSITTVGLKNNDVVSDKKQCKNSINENEVITKEIDAKLIGANKGTITIEYTTPSECKITSCSSSFLASGDFNFNGGKFVYDGVEYTIVEIGSETFCVAGNWHFINCNLTIPSTIKKIDACAFYGNFSNLSFTNKEIISINFEEGVEYIGEFAFWHCSCEKSKIVLPNTIQNMGGKAFAHINSIKELDLTALDHVINIDANPFDESRGFLSDCSTGIIRFKDQTMIDKYSNSQYWSSAAEYFGLKKDFYDRISSKYIGANEKSTFAFRGSSYEQTKISGVSNNFLATGNFNFNGGKFTYDGTEYVISEITHDVFHHNISGWYIWWYFKECNLTIPSTIKKIGDRAFYRNSRSTFLSSKEIIGLNFEEGIEDIGKEAFKACDDLKSSKLVLPNSLQHIGNNAFEHISPLKELDLSALDHVINIDADPFGRAGFLFRTGINKIWLKDEATKEKYCSHKYWSSVEKYFVLKDHISKTINSKYIGGDSNSTFDFNYLDPKRTKITGVSDEFVATGNFNFNGGKFTYDGTEHVISEIADDAFHLSISVVWRIYSSWYFKECNLTIPACIKKIGDRAFYYNSRNTFLSSKEIIGLNFEEGIEDIGKEAFYKCDDLKSSQLVLPNSLQHIGNNAFEHISPLKELDLSALDHVISL
ncbi:MAG: leucine-rich repeat protein, partial [Mycoplasmataceae bacterium]|nr:leucine-rich repeat protein [Mycoplasmataceae bacterium]